MIKVYAYRGCDSCRKALRWLRGRDVEFEEKPIREDPPSVGELRAVLDARDGDLRLLFNTAGADYRAMGMKDRLPDLSVDEALGLLADNGNLVKRPLVVGDGIRLVGFREDEWERAFS